MFYQACQKEFSYFFWNLHRDLAAFVFMVYSKAFAEFIEVSSGKFASPPLSVSTFSKVLWMESQIIDFIIWLFDLILNWILIW